MPETYTSPPVRIHRVTTRRRNLQALQCPLEPELLVAEFAGELPPEVAKAVREHIAVCETCGTRSRTLRAPYQLLASLGTEPVPSVPDLRDSVRAHVRSNRFTKNVLRAASNLTRGGAIGLSAVIAVLALAAFLFVGILYNVNAHAVSRSSNTLRSVPAAGQSGVLYAETDKLVTVQDASGHTWQVAEVVAVDERTGSIVHSLPVSTGSLQNAAANQLPVAVQMALDGGTIYEVTAPTAAHRQALVAFDANTGAVRYAITLTYANGSTLHSDNLADALAVSPDGATLYVGLANSHPEVYGMTRVLQIDAGTGTIKQQFYPGSATTVPEAPPPGGLPVSVFPSTIPMLDTTGYKISLGAHGDLAVSPDGNWLFDVLVLSDTHGPQYAVVRRMNAATGALVQELAIPGDFSIARLAAITSSALANSQAQATAVARVQASATAQAKANPGATPTAVPVSPALALPQIYLVRGSPDAQCFVLDAGDSGPTLAGTISLGGPGAPPDTSFTGTLSVSPSADGTHLYVAQNVSALQGQIVGHDLWDIDVSGMSIVSHRVDSEADAVQTNAASGGDTFILSGGSVLLVNNDLTGTPATWLSLNNGHVVGFLGATS